MKISIPIGKILGVATILQAEAASVVITEATKKSRVHPIVLTIGNSFISCLLTLVGMTFAGSVWDMTISTSEKKNK